MRVLSAFAVVALSGCSEVIADPAEPEPADGADAGIAGSAVARDAAVAFDPPTPSGYALAPTAGGYAAFGASWSVAPDGTLSVWNGSWNLPVSIEVGRAASSIVVPVRDNGPSNGHATDPNIVTASLVLRAAAGESTLASAASVGSGLQQTLTLTVPTPHVMLGGESLVLRLVPTTPTTPPRFAQFPSTVGMSTVTRQPFKSTLIVPIGPAVTSPSRVGMWQLITGVGANADHLYVTLSLHEGSVITAIKASVRDISPSLGFTHAQANLLKIPDGTESFVPIASSSLSTGSGQYETIKIAGISVATQPSTNYVVEIDNQSGSASSITKAYRLEVDYVPVTDAW